MSCNQVAPAALCSGAKGWTGVEMSIREPLLPWMRRAERGTRASTFEQWEVGRGLRQFVARQSRRPPIWPLFLIGFALLSLGLLIGPRVPDADAGANCIGNVELPGPFGFALNCDSPEFLWLARDPSGLLFHVNSRQSRPGMILLAALVQAPLSLVLPADGPPTPVYQGLYDPIAVSRSFTRDRPAYFAYLLLNFGILLASFQALRLAIERWHPVRTGAAAIILVATGLLLVANDVTKAFVWSPHTQMFNILVPVLAVLATQRAFADGRIARNFALGMGLLSGIGMTIYPVFVVIPACLLLPAVIGLWREKSWTARRRDLAGLAILLVLSATPLALWYGFVLATTGQFFHAELDLRQVIWMKDALDKGVGALAEQWFGYLGLSLAMAAPQALGLIALVAWLALTVLVGLARRHLDAARLSAAVPMIAIGLYASGAALGFYTCVGWITERLAYAMLPPLVVAAGAVAIMVAHRLPPAQRPVFAGGCLLIAIAQVIYEAAKIGPWS
jgi:hypothetical protein